VQLPIRAFEGAVGTPGTNDGTATLDPPSESSIDRVVRLTYPEDGVATVRVVLRSDCRGRPASFLSPITTCVDASNLQAAPDTGVEPLAEGALPAPIVGSWAGAHEQPCSGAAPSGAICIPGGFTMLGDKAIAGAENASGDLAPIPNRLALLSPFHLDRTEFTVGRFRQLVAAGKITTALPTGPTSSQLYCTWRGADDASNDAMPLNCVPFETLASTCAAVGGSLPSEAQYEHAARGRGQRRSFPWGEAMPQCCTASLSRKYNAKSSEALCDAMGVEPAGSHVMTAGCPGGGDVSRDGVLDLAGSLQETVLDAARPYSHPCWGQGVLKDPVCVDPMASLYVGRGADWTAGPTRGRGAFRGGHNANSDLLGFRCAYRDGAP
jgi:formylglycine-generating enzyme required for sulfatase activity